MPPAREALPPAPVVICVLLLVPAGTLADPALTGVVSRVTPARANGGSYGPAISADGRFVAYGSTATNLVPLDLNGKYGIFIFDRKTGRTRRVSINRHGRGGNGDSSNASVSADGRFVAFDSVATNLVAHQDKRDRGEVFVRDLLLRRTTRVPAPTIDGRSAGGCCPAISADGRFVAFSSSQILVYDRQADTTTPVNANGPGGYMAISADGRFVAFEGGRPASVDEEACAWGVFVHDRAVGTTTCVGPGVSQGRPAISADGRIVAFARADQLPTGIGSSEVFVHDGETGTTTALGLGGSPALSGDGRFMAFFDGARTLAVYDRTAGTVTHVTTPEGTPIRGYDSAISADGSVIAVLNSVGGLVHELRPQRFEMIYSVALDLSMRAEPAGAP